MDARSQHVANRLRGLAAHRSGVAVGLWGEPGIGKTHLAQALLRVTPCPSITVQATQPLEQLILALPRPRKPGVWLEQSVAGLEQGASLSAGHAAELLAAHLGAGAPLVILAENLHGCSAAQLQSWQDLAARVSQIRGVGLLVTSRTQPPGGFEAVRLSPLSRAESDGLLESEIGGSLPHEALGWIFERAAGHPLFTLEFFRFLARQGVIWNDGQHWRWRAPERRMVPGTVEALIEQLVAGVAAAPGLEDIIHAKALLGQGVEPALLAQVAGLSDQAAVTATAHLSREGILLEDEFAQPLYAEVITRGLTASRRQVLARRAITAYQAVPQRAAAFVADAALDPAQALNLLTQAARQATQDRQEGQAAQWLVQAVNYATGPEQAALAFEAATALKGSDLPTAIRLGELALKITPHDILTIDLLARIFATRREQDRLEQVLAHLPESEQGEGGLSRQIRLRSIIGDDQGVVELFEQHPELLESNPETCYDIGWSLLNLGRADEADHLVTVAQQHPALSDHTAALLSYLRGILCAQRADNAGAEVFFRQSLAIARTLGEIHNIISSLHAHAMVLQDLGEYHAALPELQEAAMLSLQRGHVVQYAEANLAIADQLVWFGDYDRAEGLYLESLDILERQPPHGFLIDGLNALAELYLTLDTAFNVTLARKYASGALRVSRALNHLVGQARATRVLAATLIHDGQLTLAGEQAEEALALATLSGRPRQQREALLVMSRVEQAQGDPALARQHLGEALQLAVEIAEPFPTRVIELELCALNHETSRARDHLEWFEQRGLRHGVHLVYRLFPGLAGRLTGQSAPPVPEFRLKVLGPMRWESVSGAIPVRGRKRQELLAALLEARIEGRAEVPRLSLLESLYPEQAEGRAGLLLADLVYQVRELLGAGTILTTTAGYALGSGVSSDAEIFLVHGDTRLWRGSPLSGLDPAARSETVREALCLMLQRQGEAQLISDPTEALRVADLLTDADPYNLEALGLTLRAWRGVGNPKALSRSYDQARARFLDVGERLPEHWEDCLATLNPPQVLGLIRAAT
ncbi:hypothetical protein [Deinococcus marmoris]|uniref:Pimaricin regulator n=1 Tax=Deinococcus marmoris TaxID=249408 RepID=A0A1U7NUL9_9DEIO|nr:hypothetical protein [Deinococcus marmoris]OLV16600.1 Pimaricin regulator [Deinococcus marmoris]